MHRAERKQARGRVSQTAIKTPNRDAGPKPAPKDGIKNISHMLWSEKVKKLNSTLPFKRFESSDYIWLKTCFNFNFKNRLRTVVQLLFRHETGAYISLYPEPFRKMCTRLC